MTEFAEVGARLEDSLKQLNTVRDALDTQENLKGLRSKVDRDCEKMTLRATIVKRSGENDSGTIKGVVTEVYKVQLIDISKYAYLLLKHYKKRRFDLSDGETYLIDKVKLTVNPKGVIVLISTSLTALRREEEEDDSEESIHLSQKERDNGRQATY